MSEELIEYRGWGPCVHNEAEEEKAVTWLKEILPERLKDVKWESDNLIRGGLLETFLWEMSYLGASIRLDSDQWTGCWAEGKIGDKQIKTEIQGDTFLISVAETYRWWREKYKELTGKEYDE
jgi:hypothetical protein